LSLRRSPALTTPFRSFGVSWFMEEAMWFGRNLGSRVRRRQTLPVHEIYGL
jgi:hypothetical protein